MTDGELTEVRPCHTHEECLAMYAALPAELKAPALAFLRTTLTPAQDQIRVAMQSDPATWWAKYHFGWGMATRNALRRAGFGEEYFGVHNLDDIYIELVEEALR